MKSETLKTKHVMYMIKFTIKLKKKKEKNKIPLVRFFWMLFHKSICSRHQVGVAEAGIAAKTLQVNF